MVGTREGGGDVVDPSVSHFVRGRGGGDVTKFLKSP